MRIDFHVHSKHSKRPSQWFLQKIGCPESFTEPMQIYKQAKARGMDYVTISDHNTIDGVLEIAHFNDTFISEEITSYFPEDRCKIHVLAININERQHQDIQLARQDVFELVDYLNSEQILHVLAHPLYSMNNRLSATHVEMMMVLFKNFEINGARSDYLNQALRQIVARVTPEDIDRWSVNHHITPMYTRPWEKRLIGGSDDHSSLNIARIFTEIHKTGSVNAVLAGVEEGRASVIGESSTPQTMAHNLYGIAYQFYRNKFNLYRYAGKDDLLRFLDHLLTIDVEEDTGFLSKFSFLWHYRKSAKGKPVDPENLMELLNSETRKLISDTPWIREVTKNGNGHFKHIDKKWYDFANQVSNRILVHFADHLVNHLSGANVFNIFHTIGSAGGLYTMLAPYYVAYSMFSKDIRFANAILKRFHPNTTVDREADKRKRISCFVDQLDEAKTDLTLSHLFQSGNGSHPHVITCSTDCTTDLPWRRNFLPIDVCVLDNDANRKIEYPPFLEILDYCYGNAFTHIHLDTPGPMGLIGLIIARILKLPITGSYQETNQEFSELLSEDEFTEDLVWKYMFWFYSQMDRVFVLSKADKETLTHHGIAPGKIRMVSKAPDDKQALESELEVRLQQYG